MFEMRKDKKIEEWQVESALMTLIDAEKIKAHKELFKKVVELAKQRMVVIGSVASEDIDDKD